MNSIDQSENSGFFHRDSHHSLNALCDIILENLSLFPYHPFFRVSFLSLWQQTEEGRETSESKMAT